MENQIAVNNAGVVILHSYITALFERLGLVVNNSFIDKKSQEKAVSYLYYVGSGVQNISEKFLVLDKVLCGLAINEPITEKINVTSEEKNLIDGLLKAVINYWQAIGESSVDGLRGNWIVRDGILTEKEDRWELIVEKRSYDILLNQSPFSFSIIKLPWMAKPLYITWSY